MRESKGLMGLAPPPLGYEGTVMTPVGPQEVKDGVLKVADKTLHIDKDGTVFGPEDKPIARVVNGKLAPLQQQAPQQAPQGPQGTGQ